MKSLKFWGKLLLLCSLTLSSLSIYSQIQWKNPQQESYSVIKGQAWPAQLKGSYQRIPNEWKEQVPAWVWTNSLHSAGMSLCFYSNSPEIRVRYTVANRNYGMPHMPPTGVSGIDMYATDCNGNRNICFGGYNFSDTISYTFRELSYKNTHQRGSEYELYLPLYNTVTWMEIGVPDGKELRYLPIPKEKPIVVYGTSIAHGGCASRPGMSWVNILQRNLEIPFINMGFSGSGRLDSSFFEVLAKIDSRMFIIDCMPNMTHDRTPLIYDRMVKGVKRLRESSKAPILIVEHDGYTNGKSSQAAEARYVNTNIECKKAYDELKRQGVDGLYYLTYDELNLNQESMVDGVHASDYGMMLYADAYQEKIRAILKMPKGDIVTTQAVKQRREPDNYEWNERHQAILSLNEQRPPQILMIGNSITHFWGGEPTFRLEYGKESWEKLFKGKAVTNMGCGWEKIENVFWRIYHDEISGYDAEKIFLMIGTNNLNNTSDEEIVKGIQKLAELIRDRQPKAVLHVVSIYPRRKEEEHLRRLNTQIKESLPLSDHLKYVDVSKALYGKDGLTIDESLFVGDGLHPNAKGYDRLAKIYSSYVK